MKQGILIHGRGSSAFRASEQQIAELIRNPGNFALLMPLVRSFRMDEEGMDVNVSVGGGFFRSYYRVHVILREADNLTFVLRGQCRGAGLRSDSSGMIRLNSTVNGTRADWEFTGTVNGPLSIAGSRIISRTASVYIEGVMRSANRYLTKSDT